MANCYQISELRICSVTGVSEVHMLVPVAIAGLQLSGVKACADAMENAMLGRVHST